MGWTKIQRENAKKHRHCLVELNIDGSLMKENGFGPCKIQGGTENGSEIPKLFRLAVMMVYKNISFEDASAEIVREAKSRESRSKKAKEASNAKATNQ